MADEPEFSTSPTSEHLFPSRKASDVDDEIEVAGVPAKIDDRKKLQVLAREFKKLRSEHKLLTEEKLSILEENRRVKDELLQVRRNVKSLDEEKIKLQSELDSSRSVNERMASTLSAEIDFWKRESNKHEDGKRLILEDRDKLFQQVVSLGQELNRYQEQNQELERSVKALVEKMDHLTEHLNDAEYYSQITRPVKSTKDDPAFRQLFSLPDTEFSIISYRCFYHSLTNPGILHITPAFLCFISSIPFRGTKVVIPMRNINYIVKTKHTKLFDRGLEIRMLDTTETDPSVHWLLGFTDRDTVYSEVVAQGGKFGLSFLPPSAVVDSPPSSRLNTESSSPSPSSTKVPEADEPTA
eukprot:GILJ01006812.1.p1 GENE.GILJ01006812.1~~GILJ01006812.1.p1  ORF type:complete len:354 (+),score=56.12 GILJ01006812.1:30-1091(+)